MQLHDLPPLRRALGLYFSPKQVTVAGVTEVLYTHGEKSIEFHPVQKVVAGVTHWAPAEKKTRDRMGVNCRMMEPEDVAGVRVRRLDGLDTWKYLWGRVVAVEARARGAASGPWIHLAPGDSVNVTVPVTSSGQ